MPNYKKPRPNCLSCGKETAYADYKYCSNVCQQKYQHRQFIKDWKEGKVSGIRNIGVVSKHIKKYLREKYDNKCCLCGWSKVNPKSGLIPLVADHVDGDYKNNKENNLRLICPNCDSLSPTYAALNKGRGRKERRVSKRAKTRGELSS
ncbi:MAG: HNH endonuclease [Candidatus Nomurabacteria bacterium]|nr:MAG: HNH endonuclease [Candidatus Nomurabacteria bacterium]